MNIPMREPGEGGNRVRKRKKRGWTVRIYTFLILISMQDSRRSEQR